MNANGLILGDWVLYSGRYFQIDGIAEGGFSVHISCTGWYSDGQWAPTSSVSPIPLTQEILEKNGFRFDGSGTQCMMFLSEPRFADGIRFNIYVGLKRKTIEVFAAYPIEKSPNWRKVNKVYLEVCGCYVHELQHALRFCGIEKDIVL